MSRAKWVQSSRWTTGIVLILISSAGLFSCGARPSESINTSSNTSSAPSESDVVLQQSRNAGSEAPQQAGSAPSQELAAVQTQNRGVTENSAEQNSPILRQTPQLIKTANLTLRVADVEKSLDLVSDILGKQQGDLLRLDDQLLQGDGDRKIYVLQLRVPQSNLNNALNELEALGTIKKRSIQAQDVSDQLVDSQARLKNLRKQEEMVLKIMERSGSIPEVLNVSKELSTIRGNIERTDAQLQNLKTQVAFSTVNLRLEAETASIVPSTGFGVQIQDAWKRSTSAMGTLTMAFLKLGIWGLAFSPYVIALGLLIWLGRLYSAKYFSKLDSERPQSES